MIPKVLFFTFFISGYGILGIFSFDVKITHIKLVYRNSDYIDPETYKNGMIDVNSTYTALPLSLQVLKPFPENVKLKTKIIRYESSSDKTGKSLAVTEVYPCNPNDPLRKYLPAYLIEWTASGNCIQPGNYTTNDGGQFKFYDLLPAQELQGAYKFLSLNSLESPQAFLLKYQIVSVPV